MAKLAWITQNWQRHVAEPHPLSKAITVDEAKTTPSNPTEKHRGLQEFPSLETSAHQLANTPCPLQGKDWLQEEKCQNRCLLTFSRKTTNFFSQLHSQSSRQKLQFQGLRLPSEVHKPLTSMDRCVCSEAGIAMCHYRWSGAGYMSSGWYRNLSLCGNGPS